MLLPDPSVRRAARLVLASALLCSAAAHASPQTSADPLAALLHDKGITSPFIANPTPGALLTSSATSVTAPAAGAPSFVQKLRQSASGMADSALNLLGVRYVRGGNSAEEGFDCSGFTRYLFENSLGLILPRRADEQAKAPGLVKVKRNELQPGDLVFFNTLRRTFSHVGIYLGGDKFIHAPRSGSNVRVEDMSASYWSKRFTGARRPAGSGSGSDAVAALPAAPAPAAVSVAAPSPAPAQAGPSYDNGPN